jgi:Zeta toxin
LTSIYNNIIGPRYIAGLPSVLNPRFVIICAQPGAGKSAVSKRIRSDFEQAFQKVAHIDPDLLRQYHARLEEIKMEDPVRMGDHTHEDVSVWKGFLLTDALGAKNNIVTEISLKSADNTKREIEKFKHAGYGVELHAIAVHENFSRLGIFNRFEKQLAKLNELPRYVPMALHDEAYHAMPRNVDEIERSFALNFVTVNTRGGHIVYNRVEQEGEPGAMQSILLERNRAWTAEDRAAHISDWGKVVNQVIARPSGILKPDFYLDDLRQAVLMATGQPIIHVPSAAVEQDIERIIQRAMPRIVGL